ncbi:hypothetical protein EH223_15875 [candidate division KSB1 bacterium]|nr:hypothetical protein [candidate division KSB1 bacterium]RQW01223.1 MAG: hypothetical protein EH223_15875 [candidate division KSB1 bacterium]
MSGRTFIIKIYYFIKPLLPRWFQLLVRHIIAMRKRNLSHSIWPVHDGAGTPPIDWHGWPLQKRFALVLTHDVDTAKGYERIYDLFQLEKAMGLRSSFNFVPEKYNIDRRDLCEIKRQGFEVGVHGLKHDGKLFKNYKTFIERAAKINMYLNEWKAQGFRAPCMHHNLEWMLALNIKYDASTFDTDPFEPQPDGVGTIFPFIVKGISGQHDYVELPYTLPQDCTLFVILKEKNINIWKRKLDWIVENGGMALVITHPDYMNFNEKKLAAGEYPACYYFDFLQYIIHSYHDQFWHVLPGDIASFWLNRAYQVRTREPVLAMEPFQAA